MKTPRISAECRRCRPHVWVGQQERAAVSIIGCDGIPYNLIFKYGCGHCKEVESLYDQELAQRAEALAQSNSRTMSKQFRDAFRTNSAQQAGDELGEDSDGPPLKG